MALQIRRGTEAQRQSLSGTSTPAIGEPLFTIDTRKLFIGDGSTTGGVALGYYGTVAVAGQGTLSAENNTSTLTLIAGDNVVLITDPTNDTVTISAPRDVEEFNTGSINIFQNNIVGLNSNENIVIDPSGTGVVNINSGLTVTGTITGNVIGNVTGNTTGNTSGTAASVTNASQPNITSLGTLTGLTVDGTVSATTVVGNFDGQLNGSVFGDDSTILVDAINNVHIGEFTTGEITISDLTISTISSNQDLVIDLADTAITQTFVVTSVANPGTPPPNNIYQIDGVNNPVLNLVRGGVYTFDQSAASNTNHPIAFKNGSGASYTIGVVSTGTPGQAGAQTVFTVPSNAPADLRYYCVTHGNGMGNTIAVTGTGVPSRFNVLSTIQASRLELFNDVFSGGITISSATATNTPFIINTTHTNSSTSTPFSTQTVEEFRGPQNGATMTFLRAKGANPIDPQTVVDDDEIATIDFNGFFRTDSTFYTAAKIKGVVDGTPSSGSVPGRLEFLATNAAGASGVRMTVSGSSIAGTVPFKLPTFADGAARDAAVTAPEAGMVVLTGTTFQGYNGSSWVNFN